MKIRDMCGIIRDAETTMQAMTDLLDTTDTDDAAVPVEMIGEWLDSLGGLLRLIDGFDID